MAKQTITVTTIDALKAFQSAIDTTVEYANPACWATAALKSELKEIAEQIEICDNGIDGLPADGTADGEDRDTWVKYQEMVGFILTVRANYKPLTEGQLEAIAA